MGIQLQRDLEAGVMSGEMEREGFYGEEIQLYGFWYFDRAVKTVINEDEVVTAMVMYHNCQLGFYVSSMVSKAKRFYGTKEEINEEKQKFFHQFWESLMDSYDGTVPEMPTEKADTIRFFALDELKDKMSGFVYWENGQKKSKVNGYFAQTVKWWLEKKRAGVPLSEIVLQERILEEPANKQLAQFKDYLLFDFEGKENFA